MGNCRSQREPTDFFEQAIFFKVKSEWGISSHPFLSSAKAIHIMATPLLILAIGHIFKHHIIRNMKIKKIKKVGGVALTIFLLSLIFTGELMLVITDDTTRAIFSYLHLGLGVMAFGTLIFHARANTAPRLSYQYVRSLIGYRRQRQLHKKPVLMSDISMEAIRQRQQMTKEMMKHR